MGGSRWDSSDYVTRSSTTRAAHGTSFVHDAKVRTGKVEAKAHDSLNPAAVKGGMRESRDSADHPRSNAVIIGLDVTGSMGSVVHAIHASLPKLMGLLTLKGYLEDPQICFCAVGDAFSDRVPLQVGQFESGAELEGDLSNIYIEGGGGGGPPRESYELLAFFGARMTDTDCYTKRGKLGYMFIIGDEQPYEKVSGVQLQKIFGLAQNPGDISTAAMFAELAMKYEVFVVLPEGGSHGAKFKSVWAQYVGAQNVLVLADPTAAAELIAAQIGVCEKGLGSDDLRSDLLEHGSSSTNAIAIVGSVSRMAGNSIVASTDAFNSGSARAERL
jgi:hypothetical protein